MRILGIIVLMLAACLPGCVSRPGPTSQGSLEGRSYPLPVAVEARLCRLASDLELPVNGRPDWRLILGGCGVAWPDGSSVDYDIGTGKLAVTNSGRDFPAIEAILGALDDTPKQVGIDLDILEFDIKDIESLMRRNSRVDCEMLDELQRRGKARVVSSHHILTPDGKEGSIKSGKTWTYPEAFSPVMAVGGDDYAVAAAPVVVPETFGVNGGCRISVTPSVWDNHKIISLMLTTSITDDPVWRESGPSMQQSGAETQTLNMRVPDFFTDSMMMYVDMANGARTLVGGGMPTSDGRRIRYTFMSVNICDSDGAVNPHPLFPGLEYRPVSSDSGNGMETGIFIWESSMLTGRNGENSRPGGTTNVSAKFQLEQEAERIKTLSATSGVTWPKGSSLRIVPSIHKMVAVNTPEALERLSHWFIWLDGGPRGQVETETRYIEFGRDDVSRLLEKRRANTQEAVLELWRSGKGRLLGAPKSLSNAGAECTQEASSAIHYPTGFLHQGSRSLNATRTLDLSCILQIPDAFETRGSGVSLRSVASCSERGDGFKFVPDHALAFRKPVWKDYGCKYIDPAGRIFRSGIEMPVFHSLDISQAVSAGSGNTVMIFGGVPGSDENSLVYALTSVNYRDVYGRPASSRSLEAKPDVALRAGMISAILNIGRPVTAAALQFDSPGGADTADSVELDGRELMMRTGKMGVAWPEGSSLSWQGRAAVVVNTADNVAKLKRILVNSGCIPHQIRVELEMLELSDAEAAWIQEKQSRLDVEGIRRLRSSGRGRLICAPTVLICNDDGGGSAVRLTDVVKYIYPSAFMAYASGRPAAGSPRTMVSPESFETNDAGLSLSVKALKKDKSNVIGLDLECELTTDVTWTDNGRTYVDDAGVTNVVRMEQPVFETLKFSTQTSVADGRTALICGSSTGAGGKRIYILATPVLVDVTSGKPLDELAEVAPR